MVKSNKTSADENSKAGDPNIVGKAETAPVQDRRAGPMTPSQMYDQNEPFHNKLGRK